MRIPALFWLVIILPIVSAFQPSLPLRRCSRRGHATRWSRKSSVVDKEIVTVKLPNVQDVEDETWVQPHHQHHEDLILLNRRISQESLISSISAPPQRSWAEENLSSMMNFSSSSNHFDVSSRTLKALKAAQEEGRSLIVKAREEVKAFGAYATSRALADSQLILSVTIVVASELAQILARPLLPSSAAGTSSAASGAGNATSILTLREKVELVQMGLSPIDQRPSKFILPSFSKAGDSEALLADMYAKAREARGASLFLPPLPKNLAILRAPLKVITEIPKLPLNAIKAADAAHRLNRAAIERRPSQQFLETIGSPILGTFNPSRGSKSSPRLSYKASSVVIQERTRRNQEKEGDYGGKDEEYLQLGVMPRGGADTLSAPTTWGTKGAKKSRGSVFMEGAAAATLDGAMLIGEEEEDVQFKAVQRMGKSARGGRRRGVAAQEGSDVEIIYPGLGIGGQDESDILEASVEEMALEEEKPGLRGLVFKGVVRLLDVMLLSLEFAIMEALPVVVKRTRLASQRVRDVMNGEKGEEGWDLLSVFERPMRSSQIISTRR